MSTVTTFTGGPSMPMKLDASGENFPAWRDSLFSILNTLHLRMHLDCYFPGPMLSKPIAPDVPYDDPLYTLYQSQIQSYYAARQGHDSSISTIVSIIMSGLPLTLQPVFMNHYKDNNVCRAWEHFQQRFVNNNSIVQASLETALTSEFCLKEEDIDRWLLSMETKRARLFAAGRDLSDAEFGRIIWGRLPNTYNIRSFQVGYGITHSNVIDAKTLLPELRTTFTFLNTTTPEETAPTGLLSSTNAKGRKKRDNGYHCTHCDKDGHTFDHCWKPGGGNAGGGPPHNKWGMGMVQPPEATAAKKVPSATAAMAAIVGTTPVGSTSVGKEDSWALPDA